MQELGKQGRNLEAETQEEAMEEYGLLACSIFCLRQLMTTCAWGTPPNPPVPTINQRNLVKTSSQLKFLFPDDGTGVHYTLKSMPMT